jgi:hypothetical protein
VRAHAPLAQLDAACVRCHPTKRLHLPQASHLAAYATADTMTVHGAGCAVCHQEHRGRAPIAPPDRQTCVSCHNSEDALRHELTRALNSPRRPAMQVASTGQTADLGDGVRRFLAPEPPTLRAPGPTPALKPFASYADRHPDFAYEQPQLRDPTRLNFNHFFHLTDHKVRIGGKKLDCQQCHEPATDGALMRPVRYDQHCKTAGCHELKLTANVPGVPEFTDLTLPIPHRDADKVGAVLGSLRGVSLPQLLRMRGKKDAVDIAAAVEATMKALREKGLRYPKELEEEVFFGRSGDKHNHCVECHEVTRVPDAAPRITPPAPPERWVQRGPFTHLPHRHMDCRDCHTEAARSSKTEEILLPPKRLCAECHRPAEIGAGVASRDTPSLAATQRKFGGVRADCQGCHPFHAQPAPRESPPAR